MGNDKLEFEGEKKRNNDVGNPKRAKRARGSKTSEVTPCTPRGRPFWQGDWKSPAKNRFKGIRESPERAKGEIESPPPSLAPPEVRAPSERLTIITNYAKSHRLRAGRLPGEGQRGQGSSDSPPSPLWKPRNPLKRPLSGASCPLAWCLPPGVHGVASDVFLPHARCALRVFSYSIASQAPRQTPI